MFGIFVEALGGRASRFVKPAERALAELVCGSVEDALKESADESVAVKVPWELLYVSLNALQKLFLTFRAALERAAASGPGAAEARRTRPRLDQTGKAARVWMRGLAYGRLWLATFLPVPCGCQCHVGVGSFGSLVFFIKIH